MSELSLLSDHHGHHGHSHGPPLPVPGDPLELNEVPTSQKDHIVRVVALESRLCRAPLNENNSTQLTTIESTRLSASRSTISASLGCSFTSVATPLIVCYRPMHSPRSTGSLELTSKFSRRWCYYCGYNYDEDKLTDTLLRRSCGLACN